MYIKPITYTDPFTNEQVTEPFYFNLTEQEILKIESEFGGNIVNVISNVLAKRDLQSIMNIFEFIIGMAYGERPMNSNKFVKSKESREAFLSSEAYSNLLFELLENDAASKTFFAEIFKDVPKLKSRLKKYTEEKGSTTLPTPAEPDAVVE